MLKIAKCGCPGKCGGRCGCSCCQEAQQFKEQLLSDGWSEPAVDAVLFKEKLRPGYAKGLTKEEREIAKREAKSTQKKAESGAGAKEVYEDWDSDKSYKKRKKDQGKKMPKSKATEAYERKYGKSDNAEYSEMEFNEALKNKAKKTGIPLGILRAVYAKGMAAWRTGHRPGVAPQQWAMGRVNSFITGSGKARQADAELWKKAKAALARKRK